MPRGERAQGASLTRAEGTEVTERTGSPQRNGETEVKRETRAWVRRVGLRSRPTSAIGSIVKTNTSAIHRVLVFTIDPIALRRFATPVEPHSLRSTSVRLRCSVVLPFSPSPLLSGRLYGGRDRRHPEVLDLHRRHQRGARESRRPRRCASAPARPSIEMLLKARAGPSFQRKFCTGPAISPFSIRNIPSRVMPVLSSVICSTGRMYQKNVISRPRRST